MTCKYCAAIYKGLSENNSGEEFDNIQIERNIFKEALRLAREGMEDDGWMPIETAPKDGTEIWGYREDSGPLLVRYTSPDAFLTDSELEKLDEESAFAEGWFYADFVDGGRLDGSEVPTHWQPLPPPPDND